MGNQFTSLTLGRLSRYQLLVAGHTTMHELMLNERLQTTSSTIDQTLLKQQHPNIHLMGLIGYDCEQDCFVLLDPIGSDQLTDTHQAVFSKREQAILSLPLGVTENAEND